MNFLAAYLLTLAIEAVMLFLLLRHRYDLFLIARNAAIASSLTLPFVWFFFFNLGLPWGLQAAMAEVFAVLVESAVYATLFKKITLRDAFLVSAACNWASFIFGLAVS